MFGVLALVLGGVVIGVGVMSQGDGDNPLHADVRRFDLVSDPIRMLVENHYRSKKAFPATMADIGMTQESLQNSGFSKLEFNPVNGVMRLTIAGEPRTDGFPTLAGKHLMYLPELRAERKAAASAAGNAAATTSPAPIVPTAAATTPAPLCASP